MSILFKNRKRWLFIKYNVIVEDKNGKVLTRDEIKEKVIDNEQFYLIMDLVMRKINNLNNVHSSEKNVEI